MIDWEDLLLLVVEFVRDDMSCLVSSALASMCCFNGVVFLASRVEKRVVDLGWQ